MDKIIFYRIAVCPVVLVPEFALWLIPVPRVVLFPYPYWSEFQGLQLIRGLNHVRNNIGLLSSYQPWIIFNMQIHILIYTDAVIQTYLRVFSLGWSCRGCPLNTVSKSWSCARLETIRRCCFIQKGLLCVARVYQLTEILYRAVGKEGSCFWA